MHCYRYYTYKIFRLHDISTYYTRKSSEILNNSQLQRHVIICTVRRVAANKIGYIRYDIRDISIFIGGNSESIEILTCRKNSWQRLVYKVNVLDLINITKK